MPDPLGGFAFTWPFYAAALIGYLIGSIPFGLILSKLGGEGDIRAIGSGNIGATNVLRTGRKGLALATLLLDGGKGALVVVIADAYLTQDFAVLAGGGAVLGHMFPLWLGFGGRAAAAQTVVTIIGVVAAYLLVSAGGSVSAALAGVALLAAAAWFAWGGKGVATGLGLLLAIAWAGGGGRMPDLADHGRSFSFLVARRPVGVCPGADCDVVSLRSDAQRLELLSDRFTTR